MGKFKAEKTSGEGLLKGLQEVWGRTDWSRTQQCGGTVWQQHQGSCRAHLQPGWGRWGSACPHPEPRPLRPLSPFPQARHSQDQLLLVRALLPSGAAQKNPAELTTAVIQHKWVSKDRKEILHVFRRREASRNL